MPNIGLPELVIILVIALLVLGPGKLPSVATSLGKSIREFRKAASDVSEAASLDVSPLPATPAPAASVAPAATPAQVVAPTAPPATSPAPAPVANTLVEQAAANTLVGAAEPVAPAAEPKP